MFLHKGTQDFSEGVGSTDFTSNFHLPSSDQAQLQNSRFPCQNLGIAASGLVDAGFATNDVRKMAISMKLWVERSKGTKSFIGFDRSHSGTGCYDKILFPVFGHDRNQILGRS